MNTKNHFYISASKYELVLLDGKIFGVKIVRKRTFGDKKVDCEIVLMSNQQRILEKVNNLLNQREKGFFEFYIKAWENIVKGKRTFNTKLYIIAVHEKEEWKRKIAKFPLSKELQEYHDYNESMGFD